MALQTASGVQCCRICGVVKPLSSFNYRSDSGKYRSECKPCKSDIHHRYYETKYSNIAKEKSKKKRQEDQRASLLLSCKMSARKKGLEFNITVDDIQIPEVCPILGIKLTNIQGSGRVWSNASVDRIDSSKGYVVGNVQVISCKANTMKQDATVEELRAFCINMLEQIGGVKWHLV